MKSFRYSLFILILILVLSPVRISATETGYSERVKQTISWADTVHSDNFLILGSKVRNGNNVKDGIKLFRKALKKENNSHRGMFIIYEMMAGYLYAQDNLPKSLKKQVKEYLKTANFYRGDTEKHITMYYTGLYLASQTFPELTGKEWYTGKSSKENMKEAVGWFDEWMELTTTIGQGEFDSPTYMPVYLGPIFSLYEWAKDPVIKEKARVMVHWLIGDFAVEHLNGMYVGAHSREYPERKIDQENIPTGMTAWGWMLFGKTRAHYHPTLLTAALSDFDLPEILYNIGTDRSTPYIHTETKRVRHTIRFSEKKNPAVYKYTYMTKNFALGSMMGGNILQPIQQHTWDVSFNPNMLIFSVHPYIGEKDLGMFFPEEMKFAFDEVARHHTYYGDEGKWGSSSPFEQTFQHKNALIVLYNIPGHEKYDHIDAFFPKGLTKRDVDSSGWIFCEGGNTYIAYFPLQQYQWTEEEKCFRLRSYKLKNGCVVEVAGKGDYPSFDAFKKQIKSNTLAHDTFYRTLTVSYTTSSGDVMTFTYDGTRRLNGTPVNFADYKLFKGPFLNSEIGSRKLEIKYKNKGMMLDMATQEKAQILPVYTCNKIDKDFDLTGKLDNSNWKKAQSVELFDTITGEPGRFSTKAKILYSNKYLYVGFECDDDYIWGTITERNGPVYDEECVEVFLNPSDNYHQYYEINLSPKNVAYEACVLNNRTPENQDAKFIALPELIIDNLKTAVHVQGKTDIAGEGKHWTAEYAIPLSEIFGTKNNPPKPGDTWRANFYRIDSPEQGKQEYYAWSKTERPAFHRPWTFGYLKFQ